MLKKILEDGVCPDEILNNISDEDRQIIFLEIRKEQVRKYKLWQRADEESQIFRHNPNKNGKNVGFYEESNLVSYLGEREGDKPVEELLKEEALRKAELEAEKQIQKELELIKETTETKTDSTKIDLVPGILHPVDELQNTEQQDMKLDPPESQVQPPVQKRMIKSVEQRREEMVKRKSTELYQIYINHINELEEVAVKENEELTKHWEKVEEQAKLDEEQRRKLADEARKIHAHMNKDSSENSNISEIKPPKPPLPSKKSDQLRIVINSIQKTNLSKSLNEIKTWFLENEWNKLRIFNGSDDTMPEWFHGIISREESEQLLFKKSVGSFLIRLSDKFQCYVLTYKAKTRIKHILIESKIESPFYKFFGPANVKSFQSLAELISYFQTKPLNSNSSDILTEPCGQEPGKITDYMRLLQPDCSNSKSASFICSL